MPIALRADFDAAKIRQEAKRSKNAAQARRLLALAAIYDGASRTEAAATGSVTVQIVRDWVVKFNAQGPAGLLRAPAVSAATNTLRMAMTGAMVALGLVLAFNGLSSSGSIVAGNMILARLLMPFASIAATRRQ